MKKTLVKISNVMKNIFGYGIMLTLFAGGFTFFGYLIALIIGGNTAILICDFIYKTIFPIIIYSSTSFVFLGLISMYLAGERSLVANKKNQKNNSNSDNSEKQ